MRSEWKGCGKEVVEAVVSRILLETVNTLYFQTVYTHRVSLKTMFDFDDHPET
jgi:hypothetical protein